MKKIPSVVFVAIVRWVGRLVCRIKGHRYFYPGGEARSWGAYSCVRCKELDRPIESLPYRPDDEKLDPTDSAEYQAHIDKNFECERRWISWLHYPRWI